LLTGTSSKGRPRYACSNYAACEHGKSTVSEAKLIEALRPMVKGWQLPRDVKDTSDERERLDADRLRYVQMFGEGLISQQERDAFLTPILARSKELDEAVDLSDVPTEVDWDADPATLNAQLRALAQRVWLDADFVPVAIEWTRGLKVRATWKEVDTGEDPVLAAALSKGRPIEAEG
jgi:hypothetical protein